MLDEAVRQVRRLFSSKTNSGKLVYKLTDKLHFYKQVLLATSIILLLGYSQFRDHFDCQNKISREVSLKSICWINGTTTIDSQQKQEAMTLEIMSRVNRTDQHSISSFLKRLVSEMK